jgi:excinuclease ABC subunit A
MNFLPDVYVGMKPVRENDLTEKRTEFVQGKSISDVLNMTVDEAVPFFEMIPKIHRKNHSRCRFGIHYAGSTEHHAFWREAQRIKLAGLIKILEHLLHSGRTHNGTSF